MSGIAIAVIVLWAMTRVIDFLVVVLRVKRVDTFTAKDIRNEGVSALLFVISLTCLLISEALR